MLSASFGLWRARKQTGDVNGPFEGFNGRGDVAKEEIDAGQGGKYDKDLLTKRLGFLLIFKNRSLFFFRIGFRKPDKCRVTLLADDITEVVIHLWRFHVAL